MPRRLTPPADTAAPRAEIESPPPRRLGITGYWALMREGYDELVKAIIRPPRADYSMADLGPAEFVYGGVNFVRQDVTIPNRRGLALCGSLWRRADTATPGSSFPCVVYLHGNASCRASWFKGAPGLVEDTVPSPTPAYREAWVAAAHSGARPWQVGGLARRQRARRRPPPSTRCFPSR
jgi:hypothetical protein